MSVHAILPDDCCALCTGTYNCKAWSYYSHSPLQKDADKSCLLYSVRQIDAGWAKLQPGGPSSWPIAYGGYLWTSGVVKKGAAVHVAKTEK